MEKISILIIRSVVVLLAQGSKFLAQGNPIASLVLVFADDVTRMSGYVDFIARDTFDGLFYRSVLKILQVRQLSVDREREKERPRLATIYYSEAHDYIHKARDLLSTELAALASESYNRCAPLPISNQSVWTTWLMRLIISLFG